MSSKTCSSKILIDSMWNFSVNFCLSSKSFFLIELMKLRGMIMIPPLQFELIRCRMKHLYRSLHFHLS